MERIGFADKREQYSTQLVCLALVGKSISGTLRFLTYRLFNNGSVGTYFYVLLITVLIGIYCLRFFQWKSVRNTIICVLLYVCCMVGFYLFFTRERRYFSNEITYILDVTLIGISTGTLFAQTMNWEQVFASLKPYLRVVTPIFCFIYLIGGNSFFGFMEWGQRILPLTLSYYAYSKICRKEMTKLDIFLFVISLIFSLFGGRQSFVIVFGCILISELYLALKDKKSIRRYLVLLFLIIGATIIALEYERILDSIPVLLSAFGIRSRSLSLLANERLFDLQNRNYIYEMCFKIIQERSYRISGLFADRYYLASYGIAAFAHSFVLEILIDFGTILGTVILIWLVFNSVKAFIKCKVEYKGLFFVILAIGLGRFFVSGSIFLDNSFWLYLGFIFNHAIRKNQLNKYIT